MTAEQAVFINETFFDFEELCEQIGDWNLDITKLDAGSFKGSIKRFMTPDYAIGQATFHNRMKQTGAPPSGFRTFVVPAHAGVTMLWRGKTITGNDLLLFPIEGELEASTTPNFDVITFSIREGNLLRLADCMKIRNFKSLLDSNEVFTCDRIDLDRLASSVQQNYFTQRAVSPFLIYEIMTQLIQLIVCRKRTLPLSPHKKHLHIVSTVEELILCSADSPLTIKEICNEIGTSERTLQYAFNETYQVSPKSYINAVRLNAVHKELMHTASSKLNISDIANAWGFWHMGQFAADYRKLFGKLPSETHRDESSPFYCAR